MPDFKDKDSKRNSKTGSVLDTNDNPSHYNTMKSHINDVESEDMKARITPVANIELNPIEFKYPNNEIANEGNTNLENKLVGK